MNEQMIAPVPDIPSSWDDLLDGVQTRDQWEVRRKVLFRRYLELIRDAARPAPVPLDVRVEEDPLVNDTYRLSLISYQVEEDERAFAWLGVPLSLQSPAPGVVALHGTRPQGGRWAAGLEDRPDMAFLDHLARRGFVAIAPEHFVSGRRIPPEGPYHTKRFYEKHPDWTVAGKFTYEHSLAVTVLSELPEVDPSRLGAMGHSLGGHGAYFLAAYDERIRAAACNCGAGSFRHNPDVENWARGLWYVYFRHLREDILEGKLPPIDMHEIIALIAPRAFLDVSAWNDEQGHTPTQYQRILMLRKLSELYELVGHPENFGFYVHGQKHSVPEESRDLIYRFLSARLGV